MIKAMTIWPEDGKEKVNTPLTSVSHRRYILLLYISGTCQEGFKLYFIQNVTDILENEQL